MASQTRDKILKEGPVRYRQSAMSLQRWRPRHLVFKVTHAGRLQLIVYKEAPATAANEIKEIAIDEFGGLEHISKLESEKYVFAIITTSITECFSTETPQDFSEWKQLLHEYLGKELVININVPTKQHLLKAGRGFLRIRNTGFTITTNENPPRCQGTWHIIHIRKYGGTDMFRFQTGSKCPTGEYLYSIEAKDNLGIKNLFNDLSNHRPIFTDDRLGRRMTLERRFDRKTQAAALAPSRVGPNRLSLQTTGRNSEKPVYENREQFSTMQGRYKSPELNFNDVRRASLDDGILEPRKSGTGKWTKQTTPNRRTSHQDDDKLYQNLHSVQDDKLYQNIHPSTSQRSSPTKKSHLSPVSVPVPEGYYNLTPPPLIRGRTNASPSSSPDESTLSLFSPTISDSTGLDQDHNSHEISKTLSPPSEQAEIGGVYQNVAFMRTDNQGGKRDAMEGNDEVAPIIPATITEEPWSPHNYTNVAFAKATAHGQSSGQQPVNTNQKRYKKSKVNVHKTRSNGHGPEHSKQERKISTPVRTVSRDSPVQSQKLFISTSSDDLLSPSPASSVRESPGLRNSISSMELNSNTKDKSVEYYNFCAPGLPAHSSASNKSSSLRNRLTLSSGKQSNDMLGHKSADTILSPDGPLLSAKSRHNTDSVSDSDLPSPAYTAIDNFKASSNHEKMKKRSASWDCLDSCQPEKSLPVSHTPDSHNAVYDSLAPIRDARPNLYDSLAPNREDIILSGSSSPEASDSDLNDYRTSFLRRPHKYEYVDVELENRSGDKSGSTSPIGMEHPSNWTNSLPVGFGWRNGSTAKKAVVKKETNTLSRRRQLPLQESGGEQSSSDAEYATVKKVRPPRLSKEGSTDLPDGTTSLTANIRFSAGSTSSSDSTKRESVLSNGSNSSLEFDVKVNNAVLDRLRQEHSNSPSHRVTHEKVALRVESPLNSQPQSPTSAPPLVPRRTTVEERSEENKKTESPPLPPKPQEQAPFTVQLPQTQFDFNKPPPPPKPKMLCPSDLSYAAVTFTNGQRPVYSHVEPMARSNRPSVKISKTPGDVSYVAVDFDMTEGLQRTSEQVADHHREFLGTKQS